MGGTIPEIKGGVDFGLKLQKTTSTQREELDLLLDLGSIMKKLSTRRPNFKCSSPPTPPIIHLGTREGLRNNEMWISQGRLPPEQFFPGPSTSI